MRPERVVQVGGRQLRRQRHQVRQRVHVLVGRAEGRSDLSDGWVTVDEDARVSPASERSREVGRDERGARSTAGRVHRDDVRAPVESGRPRPGRGRRGRQRLAVGRPHEEAIGSGADGRPQRADRFPRVDGQEWPRSGHVGQERRLADHGIRLELPHRLPQLSVVRRGGDDARVPAPIEEMHDLFRDVVLLHGEHDPCDVLHVPSS